MIRANKELIEKVLIRRGWRYENGMIEDKDGNAHIVSEDGRVLPIGGKIVYMESRRSVTARLDNNLAMQIIKDAIG